MTDAEIDFQAYSDCFKDLHGFRPRGEILNSPEFIESFWATYDLEFDAMMAREAEEAEMCERLRAEQRALRVEQQRWDSFWHPEFYEDKQVGGPVVEAWMHGDEPRARRRRRKISQR